MIFSVIEGDGEQEVLIDCCADILEGDTSRQIRSDDINRVITSVDLMRTLDLIVEMIIDEHDMFACLTRVLRDGLRTVSNHVVTCIIGRRPEVIRAGSGGCPDKLHGGVACRCDET